MPVRGTKPKDDDRKRFRGGLTHDWTDVPDQPFAGKVPVRLPSKREISTAKGVVEVSLTPFAREWWATVRAMPHCVLWRKSDWLFALATALIADLSARGVTSAGAELRQRERVLGMTLDARRDLRIRYVDPAESKPSGGGSRRRPAKSSTVTSIADRRNRMTSAS